MGTPIIYFLRCVNEHGISVANLPTQLLKYNAINQPRGGRSSRSRRRRRHHQVTWSSHRQL
jgi:hypothetical protein